MSFAREMGRGLVKQAEGEWQKHLLPALLGGGGMALLGDDENWLSNAILGATLGGGGSYAFDRVGGIDGIQAYLRSLSKPAETTPVAETSPFGEGTDIGLGMGAGAGGGMGAYMGRRRGQQSLQPDINAARTNVNKQLNAKKPSVTGYAAAKDKLNLTKNKQRRAGRFGAAKGTGIGLLMGLAGGGTAGHMAEIE